MRILVVEDERKVADFLKRGLQQPQHIVRIARSIAEADDGEWIHDYDLLSGSTSVLRAHLSSAIRASRRFGQHEVVVHRKRGATR